MTGEFVLKEFERVLITKLNVPKKNVMDTIQFLRQFHVEPIPQEPSEIIVRDEDDRWVLESALRANADILVTGDKDLLVLSNTVSGLEIISPRGIWDSLKK